MNMPNIHARILPFMLALAFALLAAGCGVPERVVEEKDAALAECRGELDRCRTARSDCEAQRADLETEIAGWRERAAKDRADLEAAGARIAVMGDELAECIRSTQAARETLTMLEARERELRTRLRREIEARDVEIELLRDQLSVRILERILFDTGKADIRPEGRAVLDKVGPVIAGGDEYVRVEGHTDDVPIGLRLQERYPTNWELAGARGASVVRYFQERHGIDPRRMEAVGHSYYRPVAPNDSPENRQRNRRVEIVLTAAEPLPGLATP